MKLRLNRLMGAACIALLAACAGVPEGSHPSYAAVDPINYPQTAPAVTNGAIYQINRSMSLFEDVRAHQVGDIVTVLLSESTDATKSSDTSLDKTSSNSIADPVLAGKTRVLGTDSNLGFELSSGSEFSGESSSAQRNRMQGTIAVTVANVLPNGNLFIQGEKWIHINQGNEYIRLRGIVRPVDISTNNTILSHQIADARLSYSGTGPTAEVNAVGWLSRFFMSPLWPF